MTDRECMEQIVRGLTNNLSFDPKTSKDLVLFAARLNYQPHDADRAMANLVTQGLAAVRTRYLEIVEDAETAARVRRMIEAGELEVGRAQ